MDNFFYFIGDLFAINDHLEFDKKYKDIYPSDLGLEKKSTSSSEASFWDVSIMTENKKINTKLFG